MRSVLDASFVERVGFLELACCERCCGCGGGGDAMISARLFSTDSAKAIKADKYGYLNAIHYLAPADSAGVGNICPKASVGCKAACLGEHAGMVTLYRSVRASRRSKTIAFMRHRKVYIAALIDQIRRLVRKASRLGKPLVVRLNGSSDIVWERLAPEIFREFPDVQFVEYTKIPSRFNGQRPANLCLTFSRSENNEADCLRLLARGENVSVLFEGVLPASWNGYPVIDGTLHDLRHLDPRGVVVGLRPLGARAKADATGFVVREAA